VCVEAVDANALELVVGVVDLQVRHEPLLLASRGRSKRPYGAYLSASCITQSASGHSVHLYFHAEARIHRAVGKCVFRGVVARVRSAPPTLAGLAQHTARHTMLIHNSHSVPLLRSARPRRHKAARPRIG
jgi:hypothetical protein